MGACLGCSDAPTIPIDSDLLLNQSSGKSIRHAQEVRVSVQALLPSLRASEKGIDFLIKLRASLFRDGLEILQQKENADLRRALGIWIHPLAVGQGRTEEWASEVCTFPGCELKYGCNKLISDADLTDEASAVAAYRRTTVDRDGHLYFSVLGARWSKFRIYEPFAERCAPPEDAHMRSLLARGYATDSAAGRYLASYLAANSDVRTAPQEAAPTVDLLRRLCAAGSSEGDFQLREFCDHVLDRAVQKEKVNDNGKRDRTGEQYFSLCNIHWDAIRREESTALRGKKAGEVVSNAGNLLRFMASLRSSGAGYGASEQSATSSKLQAFCGVQSSADCERLFLRQPNRLDFWFQHLLLASQPPEHLRADNVADDEPPTTGAHVMRTVGRQYVHHRRGASEGAGLAAVPLAGRLPLLVLVRRPRPPSDATPVKPRLYNGYEWKYGPDYDRRFDDEVACKDLDEAAADTLEKAAMVRGTGSFQFKRQAKDASPSPVRGSALSTEVLEAEHPARAAQQAHLSRLRSLIRSAVKRNHGAYERARLRGAGQATRMQQEREGEREGVKCKTQEKVQGASASASASASSVAPPSHHFHLDRSALAQPRSERQSRMDHSLHLYAHMKLFLFVQNESQRQLQELCAREQKEEERAERRRRRAERLQQQRDLAAEKEKARMEALAAVNERIAANAGHHASRDAAKGSTPESPDEAQPPTSSAPVTDNSIGEAEDEESTGGMIGSPIRSGGGGGVRAANYRDFLGALTPADIGNTTYGSGSSWMPLASLIRLAWERTEGGSHHRRQHSAEEEDVPAAAALALTPTREEVEAQRSAMIATCTRKFQRVLRRLLLRRPGRPPPLPVHAEPEPASEQPESADTTAGQVEERARDARAYSRHYAAFAAQVRDEEALFPLLGVCSGSESVTAPLAAKDYSRLLDNDALFCLLAEVFRQVGEEAHELKRHLLARARVSRVAACAADEAWSVAAPLGMAAGLPTFREVATDGGLLSSSAGSSDPSSLTVQQAFDASAKVSSKGGAARISFAQQLQGQAPSSAASFLHALVAEEMSAHQLPAPPSSAGASNAAPASSTAGIFIASGAGQSVCAHEASLTLPVYLQSDLDLACDRLRVRLSEGAYRIRKRPAFAARREVLATTEGAPPSSQSQPSSTKTAGSSKSRALTGAGTSADRGWHLLSATSTSPSSKDGPQLSALCPRMDLRRARLDSAPHSASESPPLLSLEQMVQLVFTRQESQPFVRDSRLHSMFQTLRGDCSGLFVSLRLTLDFGDEEQGLDSGLSSSTSAGSRHSARRPSATLRMVSRDRKATSAKDASTLALGDAPTDVTLERTIQLSNWRALLEVLSARRRGPPQQRLFSLEFSSAASKGQGRSS